MSQQQTTSSSEGLNELVEFLRTFDEPGKIASDLMRVHDVALYHVDFNIIDEALISQLYVVKEIAAILKRSAKTE